MGTASAYDLACHGELRLSAKDTPHVDPKSHAQIKQSPFRIRKTYFTLSLCQKIRHADSPAPNLGCNPPLQTCCLKGQISAPRRDELHESLTFTAIWPKLGTRGARPSEAPF